MDHAIDDLTHAIKIIPDFMTAYYLRGQVYGIQEEKNNALADFNTVLKIRSHYEDTERFISLLQNNKTFPHHLDIPNDTYDQPEWDPNGYSNYLPDKDRIYRL